MIRILVVAELSDVKLAHGTLVGIAVARQLVEQQGGSFDIIVMGGEGSRTVAKGLMNYGAVNVLLVEDKHLTPYLAEWYVPTLASLASRYDFVVAGAGGFSSDLFPRVAGSLGANYLADCSGVRSETGQAYFLRNIYAGTVTAEVKLIGSPSFVTARLCDFVSATLLDALSHLTVIPLVEPGTVATRISIVRHSSSVPVGGDLTIAPVIVSGGRPLKQRFVEVLAPLAEVIGGCLGASRAACDAGYAPQEFQIGQTGKFVAPRLYIAIGISGSIQHLAGMKSAKTIVAINKDANAPIFNVADYGLVADLFETVPPLVAELESYTRT